MMMSTDDGVDHASQAVVYATSPASAMASDSEEIRAEVRPYDALRTFFSRVCAASGPPSLYGSSQSMTADPTSG